MTESRRDRGTQEKEAVVARRTPDSLLRPLHVQLDNFRIWYKIN